jgi:hypothetical protein
MPVADALRTFEYLVLDVPVSVASDTPAVLCRVDETYAAFRQPLGDADGDVLAFELRRQDDGFLVSSPDERTTHPDEHSALLSLFDRMVKALLARLAARGLDAIHAGAVVHRGRAAIVAGTSGQGKTTLTLGLVGRGAQLLSDEFAIVDRTAGAARIVPYRRSLHVRPGTPELVPALSFVHDLPRHTLGGGIEWSVEPALIERALPGCLGQAAPLGHVLLLDGRPAPEREPTIAAIPAAMATMELLKGTYSASLGFAGALRRLSAALDGVTCARLTPGALEPTLDLVTAWLERSDG